MFSRVTRSRETFHQIVLVLAAVEQHTTGNRNAVPKERGITEQMLFRVGIGNEIIEVDATGTGCLLIHRSVLEYMQENANPNQGRDWAWFAEGAINGTYFGEDLLFSKRLKSFGYKIHAHTGAILPHQKEFWLDQRHHKAIRDFASKQDQA